MALIDNIGDKAHVFTHEEHVAAGKKGGIRSGEARREKKALQQLVRQILAMPLQKGKTVDVDKITSINDIKGKNIDVQTAIIIAQVQKAIKGDVVAATFLRNTAGEDPIILARNEGVVDVEEEINDAGEIIFAVREQNFTDEEKQNHGVVIDVEQDK